MNHNLIQDLYSSFAIFADKTALAYPSGEATHFMTYDELRRRSETLAYILKTRRIDSHDTVVFWGGRLDHSLIAYIATLFIGASLYHIQPHDPPELSQQALKWLKTKIAIVGHKKPHTFIRQTGWPKTAIVLEDSGEAKLFHRELDFHQFWEQTQKAPDSPNSPKARRLQHEIHKRLAKQLEIAKGVESSLYLGQTYGQKSKIFRMGAERIRDNARAISQVLPMNYSQRIFFWPDRRSSLYRSFALAALWRGATLSDGAGQSPLKTLQGLKPHVVLGHKKHWHQLYNLLRRRLRSYPIIPRLACRLVLANNRLFKRSLRFFTQEQTLWDRRKPKTRLRRLGSNLMGLALGWFIYLISPLLCGLSQRELKANFLGIALGPPFLAKKVDTFLDALPWTLLQAYLAQGSGGAIAMRRPSTWMHRPRRVLHTAGPLLPHTDIKLVDPSSKVEISHYIGAWGEIWIQGSGAPEAIPWDKAPEEPPFLDKQRWLHTNELGRFTVHHELQVRQ
jgi:long-subunit acyl-CoA synthetase (AMP-forming)